MERKRIFCGAASVIVVFSLFSGCSFHKHSAGKGTWNDDPRYTNALNNYSIGIELVAMGSKNDMAQYMSAEEYDQLDPNLMGYTEAQYASLSVLVRDICERNDIPMDREHVIGHEEYSPHKSDPGELFDWTRLISEE